MPEDGILNTRVILTFHVGSEAKNRKLGNIGTCRGHDSNRGASAYASRTLPLQPTFPQRETGLLLPPSDRNKNKLRDV
jgi:hypothetical protein